MGTMTFVRRTGERFKRDGYREKDGRVKSKLVSNTVDVVSENDAVLRAHMTETMTRSQTTSQFRLMCTQHSCTRMSIKTCLQTPPEPDEWYDARLKEDEVWKLNKALHGYRNAPEL